MTTTEDGVSGHIQIEHGDGRSRHYRMRFGIAETAVQSRNGVVGEWRAVAMRDAAMRFANSTRSHVTRRDGGRAR